MKMRHLLTLLTALALLAGCGASATAHRTAPAGATYQELPDVSWQSALARRDLGKIELPLWRWLDGDSPDDLGVPGASDETAQVTVHLRHGLYEDEVAHYQRLGLAAAQGEDRPSGEVSRDQLLELARDHNVLEVAPQPVAPEAADTDTATAQADGEGATTAQADTGASTTAL